MDEKITRKHIVGLRLLQGVVGLFVLAFFCLLFASSIRDYNFAARMTAGALLAGIPALIFILWVLAAVAFWSSPDPTSRYLSRTALACGTAVGFCFAPDTMRDLGYVFGSETAEFLLGIFLIGAVVAQLAFLARLTFLLGNSKLQKRATTVTMLVPACVGLMLLASLLSPTSSAAGGLLIFVVPIALLVGLVSFSTLVNLLVRELQGKSTTLESTDHAVL